jgi:stage II sporulation protein D
MIARIFLAALAFVPFACDAGVWESVKTFFIGSNQPKPPTIRVLIAKDLERVPLEITGKYSLYDPYMNKHKGTRYVGKSNYIQGFSSGIKWGEEFPDLFQLKFQTEDSRSKILVNGIEYPGLIYVYNVEGAIDIVNEVDVEHYLHSILATQFDQHLSGETLAAIAIAARTNAYFQAVNLCDTLWTVDAEQVGYLGNDNHGCSRKIASSIDVTRNMVMSRTGAYEGVTTPFALHWGPIVPSRIGPNQVIEASISIEQAEQLAQKGYHAAQILSQAFPGSAIMMVHHD